MANQWSIRTATLADLDEIWQIETAVFRRDAWSREMMREELVGPHRSYRVMVDAQGRILGYAGTLVVAGEGDVQTIALVPEARGAGGGRVLLNALLDDATRMGAHQVFLEVRADNLTARQLYENTGFQEIGVRPHYYQPEGVDAIVMKLQMENRR